MLVSERFEGSRTPFEGDRQLVLRNLPEGAQVTKATILLEPVAAPGGVLFEETLTFSGDQGEWGARKLETTTFAEVDFHARRTLSSVTGSGLLNATLQVDIGGLYVQINELGAMSTPDDGVGDFTVLAAAGGLLPSLASQKFKLSLPAAGQPRITRVGIRSAPSNLVLHLEGQAPFWARPGELARSETVPDFSLILNTFLADAEAQDGYYEIPLTIHSDSLCRLDVSVEIEFVQKQAALPGGLSEAALTFDYSTLSTGPEGLVTVRLPVGARVLPGQTTARVRGSFADSRIVCGPTGKIEPAGAVSIAPGRAQAAPLVFADDLSFASVDLLLASVSRTAELALDLVEDADGRPFSTSVIPSQVRLGIDSQVQGKPTWVSVALPAEVQVKAGVRVWLVLQSLSGEANWSVASRAQAAAAAANGGWTAGEAIAADQSQGADLGILYTDTGGLSWRAESVAGVSGALVSFLHLRQPPARYQVPVELQVGEGDAARRVSLQRFEPLGRVDFNLDFAEVAEAINQAAAAAAAAIPQGEHLLNNEFEAWHRVGDTPGSALVRYPFRFSIFAVETSPDGARVYLALSTGEAALVSYLIAMDTVCLELVGMVVLPVGPPEAIALSPDGRRACVSTAANLVWVDVENWRVLGAGHGTNGGSFLDARPGKMVFSPDGSRIYYKRFLESDSGVSDGSIRALDVAGLEAKFLAGDSFETSDVSLASIDLGDNIEPVDLAISSDGRRVYVLTADHSQATFPASVHIFDAATRQNIAPSPVPAGENPIIADLPEGVARGGLALSQDGRRLVAVNSGSGTAVVLALPSGIRVGITPLSGEEDPWPVAAEMDKDGNYAVIADFRNRQLIAFDLTRQREVRNLFIDSESPPVSLAALAGGERVYAACAGSETNIGLAALPMGSQVPDEWSLTSGRVQPLCLTEPYHRAAVLGDFSVAKAGFQGGTAAPPGNRLPSALSQVFPVVGAVNYDLSFYGLASNEESLAEVFWYGSNCSVQQVDRLPVQAYDGPAEEMLQIIEIALAFGIRLPAEDRAEFHRLAMVSPPGAELAELRFSSPANQAAVVDRAAFQATADSITNGDLQQLDQGNLAGWTLAPAGAPGVVLSVEPAAGGATGLRIRNAGAAQVALEQAVAFPAQVSYELTFIGRGEASPAGVEPRLELTFLDESGGILETNSGAGIGAQGSDRLSRRGESPGTTAAALIRLVVPPGGSMLAQRVAFQELAMVEVPLNFVAQAPGDLNISGLQVVYEMQPAPPSRTLPAGGLCPPTPPEGAPGAGRRGCCYCPSCGETDDLCDAHEAETPGGQPALEGACCHCGASQQHIGGGGAVVSPPPPGVRPPTATVPPPGAGGVATPAGTVVVATPAGSSATVSAAPAMVVTRAALPVAVARRVMARGAAPMVVRMPGAVRPRVAGVSLESHTAVASLFELRSASAQVARMRDLFTGRVPPPIQEGAPVPDASIQPPAPAEGQSPPVESPAQPPAPVEVVQPAPPALPPITEVTGVTAAIASRLVAAGLEDLRRLAEATPSRISAALPRKDMQTAKRISQNARRLLRKITS